MFLGQRDLAEILVFDAAEAAEHGESERLEGDLRRLSALGGPAGAAMTASLVDGLRDAWEGGWQPADVALAAGKRLGGIHAELAAEMITMEARTWSGSTAAPEAWAAQLAELERTPRSDDQRWSEPGALRIGAGLMGMLLHLPVVPCLLPPPSRWGRLRRSSPRTASTVDGRVLDKVRALLAKAESTEFEEEADALTAKAQELMARHAIDQAMVAAVTSSEEPGGRRIGVSDPYAQSKAHLLAVIAQVNRCRSVWMAGYGFSTVFGFAGDVDIVEVFYLSLLVQATRAMTASGAVRDRAGRSRTRSFRQSFLLSFARRIGERLQTATRTATAEASEVHGSHLLPVLAGRAAAVDEAFDALFPDLVAILGSDLEPGRVGRWPGGRRSGPPRSRAASPSRRRRLI